MVQLQRVIGALLGLACMNTSVSEAAIFYPDGSELDFPRLAQELQSADVIVLGEEHYNPEIQNAQAQVIRNVLARSGKNQSVVGWEFLLTHRQTETQTLFAKYAAGEISGEQFLDATQPVKSLSYLPILEAARDFAGMLWGVNLSRAEKAPVTRGEIDAASGSDLFPAGYEACGPHYAERFLEIMRDHVAADKIAGYLAAQCLTDDVMAVALLQAPGQGKRFLVTGAFHSDYNGGVVARLQKRGSGLVVKSVRFLNPELHSGESPALTHPLYGPLADYIVVVAADKGLASP